VVPEGSDGDVDYATVGGYIWRHEGAAGWQNTGLKDNEVSEATRHALGLDEEVVLFPDEEVAEAIERATAELEQVRVEVS
jgi:hypothetical protein